MPSSPSRHVYTSEQRVILEDSFARQSHPDITEKDRLANLCNCNLIQISNWFQNHRRRVKKYQQLLLSSYQPYNSPQPEYTNESSPNYYYYYYCYPSSQYAYASSCYPQPSYEQAFTFDPCIDYCKQ